MVPIYDKPPGNYKPTLTKSGCSILTDKAVKHSEKSQAYPRQNPDHLGKNIDVYV